MTATIFEVNATHVRRGLKRDAHDESPTVAAFSAVPVASVVHVGAGPPEASRAAVAPVSAVRTQEQRAVGWVDIIKALRSGSTYENAE